MADQHVEGFCKVDCAQPGWVCFVSQEDFDLVRRGLAGKRSNDRLCVEERQGRAFRRASFAASSSRTSERS